MKVLKILERGLRSTVAALIFALGCATISISTLFGELAVWLMSLARTIYGDSNVR